ncbi:MAG: ester cyclase [Anaerolineae bacterium]
MPIITVQFIEDVVATPEQKKQLIVELTNTFVGILGDVVRPFVYTIIQETPQQEWGIAGVPMPDLVYLTSDKHARVIERSNDLMRGAIAQMAAAQTEAAAVRDESADAVWRGSGAANGSADADRRYWERWFDELWNKKNYDIVYEYVDDNFTAHGAGGQQIKMGPNGPKDMVKSWHAAMPDGRMTIDDIITEGDLSTIRMTWRGTHTGPFGDIPASGKKIEVTSIGIDRVVNGKITEGWGELNMLGMLMQMGAIPSPDQQPAADPEKARVNRNRDVVHRFHEAMNAKHRDALFELAHSNFVNHTGTVVDPIGVKTLVDSSKPSIRRCPTDAHQRGFRCRARGSCGDAGDDLRHASWRVYGCQADREESLVDGADHLSV